MTTNVYWLYLEEVRKSGVTNMYFANSFLMDKFDISYEESETILDEWMKNYNPEDYADE